VPLVVAAAAASTAQVEKHSAKQMRDRGPQPWGMQTRLGIGIGLGVELRLHVAWHVRCRHAVCCMSCMVVGQRRRPRSASAAWWP
jgi:hypothetical protein